jgi:hypothetical protein
MKFTKPKGATADLREMEYISALHQTGKELRQDGSIDGELLAAVCVCLLDSVGARRCR